MKVLMVGNEEGVRETMVDMLEFLGHAATQMCHEEIPSLDSEAVAFFDLAVVDLGYNLAGRKSIACLKSHDPRLGVILLSGRASEEEAKGYGANLLLRKPFTLLEAKGAIVKATATKMSVW